MTDKQFDASDLELERAERHEKPPRLTLFNLATGCLLPLILVGAALGGAYYLIITAPKAKQRQVVEKPTLVRVVPVEAGPQQVIVPGMGTMVAAQEVMLQPQVSGEIVEVGAAFKPGGKFDAGDLIVRLDPADYELALQQRHGELARAEEEYQLELGRQGIAAREWELLGDENNTSDLDRELALRQPQLRKAEAALAAARAAVEQARLNLARTEVKAPFNAVVLDKMVDLGTQVSAQTQLAHLAGTDVFWVQVALPPERLAWLTIPRNQGDAGSAARVIHRRGPENAVVRPGTVTRLLSRVEPAGRMARVLVTVPDPLGLHDSSGRTDPLLLGAYVRVEIEGRRLARAVRLPRTALRDDDTVWVMDQQNQLDIRPVEVAWRDPETVMITAGLADGERVVVSNLATAVPGMALRTPEDATEDTEATSREAATTATTDGTAGG